MIIKIDVEDGISADDALLVVSDLTSQFTNKNLHVNETEFICAWTKTKSTITKVSRAGNIFIKVEKVQLCV